MCEKKDFNLKIDKKDFEEATKSITEAFANTKLKIPDIVPIIPNETFTQLKKIARMNELIAEQISIPESFFTQFKQIEELNKQINSNFKIPNSLIQQIHSIPEINNKLTKSFQIPASTLGTIQKIQKSNSICLIQANSALERIKEINTSFLSSINPIFNIGFNFEGLFDSMSELFEFTDDGEFKNFEYNWAGFLTIPKIKELYGLWKKDEKDKVKDFFYQWLSDKKEIDNLIEDFNKNDIFEPRMHILEKALKAHLNSDYELSIPIFLSQIDGIFIEKHKDLDGKISFRNRCQKCGEDVKIKAPLNAKNICNHILNKENEYLPFFLKHIIDTFDNLRNDIVHGKKLDYPDKDLSIKLILTLLELNYTTHFPQVSANHI